jgi:hypothetical protein
MGSGTSGSMTPGTLSSTPGMSTWTDPRTGLVFASQAIAQALGYDKPITYNLNSNSPSFGAVDNGQVGSQFWMDSKYTGEEPTAQVKQMLSTADYARDWLGTYAANLKSPVGLSPNAQAIQKYPTTLGSAEIWATVPELNPANAVTYNTAANSAGSTNEPAHVTAGVTGQTSGLTGGSEPSTGSTIIDKIQSGGLALVAVVLVVLAVLYFAVVRK